MRMTKRLNSLTSRMSNNLQASSAQPGLDDQAKISRPCMEINECVRLCDDNLRWVRPGRLVRLIGVIPAKHQKEVVREDVLHLHMGGSAPLRRWPHLPPHLPSLTSIRRKWFASFTLSVTLAELVSGTNPAIVPGTLIFVLTCALVRTATHLSYLTDRC